MRKGDFKAEENSKAPDKPAKLHNLLSTSNIVFGQNKKNINLVEKKKK